MAGWAKPSVNEAYLEFASALWTGASPADDDKDPLILVQLLLDAARQQLTAAVEDRISHRSAALPGTLGPCWGSDRKAARSRASP